MLLPNPAQQIRPIILILREPQFPLLRHNVKDLALHIGKIRISAFPPRLVDAELEQTRADEHRTQVRGAALRQRQRGAVGGGGRRVGWDGRAEDAGVPALVRVGAGGDECRI